MLTDEEAMELMAEDMAFDIPIKHESKPYLMIPLPDGATNGDMLCYMFPDMHYTLSDKSPRVVTTIGIAASFDMDWWNALYKRGDKNGEGHND